MIAQKTIILQYLAESTSASNLYIQKENLENVCIVILSSYNEQFQQSKTIKNGDSQ